MDTSVCVFYADSDEALCDKGLPPNQLYRNPRINIENRTVKELDRNHIRINMMYAGLCGTDMHLLQTNKDTGYILGSAPVDIPKEGRIIGHEGVGRIIEVGSNVGFFSIGDYVTFESIISCKVCSVCRRGDFNQCKNSSLLGLQADGIYGTIVDIPAVIAHNINEFSANKDDLKAAACIEPASVAYVACENAKISPGDVVLVLGAGPIGAFSAMLSKTIFGASAVYAVEPVQFRRNFVKKWADHVFESIEELSDSVKYIDKIVETSGCLSSLNTIFHKLSENSDIVLLARTGSKLSINAVDHMITNRISITGSRGHLGRAFQAVMNLQKTGRIKLQEVITNEYHGIEKIKDTLMNGYSAVMNENCKIVFNLQ